MKEPQIEYRFGVVADTQGRENKNVIKETLAPLKEAEESGIKIDFITHIGDLAATGEITKFIIEAKIVTEQYQNKEKVESEFTEELNQYERALDSDEFSIFSQNLKREGMQDEIVIYALWLAKEKGVYAQAIDDMTALIENVTKSLGEFKTEVRHVIGNADRTFPEKLEAVERLLEAQNITSYNKPTFIELDEANAIVFWPSMDINEEDQEQSKLMHKMIDEFSAKLKTKKTVLIFAHETPFKGPKKPGEYQDRIANAGFEKNRRTPYVQFRPISKYVLELCRRLPAQTKVTLVCGHMHNQRGVIQAGMPHLKFNEQGKTSVRLFGGAGKAEIDSKYEIISGGRRTIDLCYLPEGEVGLLEIDSNGDINYKNLT
ncbi:MAG: hypothetical protein WCJ51_02675 [Candidatus Moraniibacteriota bacterium]